MKFLYFIIPLLFLFQNKKEEGYVFVGINNSIKYTPNFYLKGKVNRHKSLEDNLLSFEGDTLKRTSLPDEVKKRLLKDKNGYLVKLKADTFKVVPASVELSNWIVMDRSTSKIINHKPLSLSLHFEDRDIHFVGETVYVMGITEAEPIKLSP